MIITNLLFAGFIRIIKLAELTVLTGLSIENVCIVGIWQDIIHILYNLFM